MGQHFAEKLARGRIIVDDEDRTAGKVEIRRLARTRDMRFSLVERRSSSQRQKHPKRGALVDARAFRRHMAAMQLDDVFDNREPEAEAAVFAREALIGLPEAIEGER